MFLSATTSFRLTCAVFLSVGLVLAGCDNNDSGMEEEPSLRSVSYPLEARSNDGAIPEGVSGTITFWEVNPQQTLATLALDEGATDANVAHPAHIHRGAAGDGGEIAVYLTPIDGSGGGGTSARIIQQSYDALVGSDAYVNVHESVSNSGAIVAQGNIGDNAEGDEEEGLALVDDLQSTAYPLSASANEGNRVPNGVDGTVTVQALTDEQALVSIALDAEGGTGADVAHPAHIHANGAEEGGDIQYYLGPVDGSDATARSSKLVDASYETLTGSDGHVNIHESVGNRGVVVSQGDIGVNAQN